MELEKNCYYTLDNKTPSLKFFIAKNLGDLNGLWQFGFEEVGIKKSAHLKFLNKVNAGGYVYYWFELLQEDCRNLPGILSCINHISTNDFTSLLHPVVLYDLLPKAVTDNIEEAFFVIDDKKADKFLSEFQSHKLGLKPISFKLELNRKSGEDDEEPWFCFELKVEDDEFELTIEISDADGSYNQSVSYSYSLSKGYSGNVVNEAALLIQKIKIHRHSLNLKTRGISRLKKL